MTNNPLRDCKYAAAKSVAGRRRNETMGYVAPSATSGLTGPDSGDG